MTIVYCFFICFELFFDAQWWTNPCTLWCYFFFIVFGDIVFGLGRMYLAGADIYLNKDDVKKVIHVDEVSTEWTIFSDIVTNTNDVIGFNWNHLV